MRKITAEGYGAVMALKDELARIEGSESIRDFGGIYLVHGRYLLRGADLPTTKKISMVDVSPRDEYLTAVQEWLTAHPGVVHEFVQGDFRNSDVYTDLAPVDVSLLYEVLLHQENYVEVIRNVTTRSRMAVCVAQPVLRERLFSLPSSATLVQFLDEDLKNELRNGSFWPEEPRVDRFSPNFWMWGHTPSHLIDVFAGFGWTAIDPVLVTNVCGDYWDYLLVRFSPPSGSEAGFGSHHR
jgi:hypothetical protein